MLQFWISVAGLLVVAANAQTATPQCQDVHTESCMHFHDANPGLCSDPTFADNMCKRFCGNCPLECHSCEHPVRDPRDCNTTATCDKKSQCATRHMKATDGHHEYLMSCESKELCDLVAFGFGFGKRTIDGLDELPVEGRGRFERGVMMTCCGTDLCNDASATAQTTGPATGPATGNATGAATGNTTGATTGNTTGAATGNTTGATTGNTTTTGSVQTNATSGACMKDVVFVMQNHFHQVAHGSIGSPKNWVSFARQLAAQINVGSNQTHVAAVIYDVQTRTQWYLNQHTTDTDLNAAITHLATVEVGHRPGVGTRPDLVLTEVGSTVLDSAHGDRPQAGNVVVLLDIGGLNYDYYNIASAVTALHAKSDKVVLVSVGKTPDANHHGIATDGSHQFYTSSYGGLTALLPKIASLICS